MKCVDIYDCRVHTTDLERISLHLDAVSHTQYRKIYEVLHYINNINKTHSSWYCTALYEPFCRKIQLF